MKKVLIDPGHGGKYKGRVVKIKDDYGHTYEVSESGINLEFVRKLNNILLAAGVDSCRTRSGDYALDYKSLDNDLTMRSNMANSLKADCFVSIHCNGYDDSSVNGFEVFTSPGQTDADNLAQAIFYEVEKTGLVKMRSDLDDGDSDRESNFAVLMRTECQAVLVELGFITNEGDRKLIMGEKAQEYAEAVARGILRFVMP